MPDEVGTGEVRALIRDLGKVPEELRRRLGRDLRRVAEPMVSDARRRAAWSTRIPGAISARSQFAGPRPGVSIRVSARRAPHARAYEGLLNSGGTFRHPVFGREREIWVTQRTRPFLLPAVRLRERQVIADAVEIVDLSARLHGWR